MVESDKNGCVCVCLHKPTEVSFSTITEALTFNVFIFIHLTSSARFGALRPALQRPLVGVKFSQKDIVVGDKGQQVFVDDIFISQADFGVFFLGNDLQ